MIACQSASIISRWPADMLVGQIVNVLGCLLDVVLACQLSGLPSCFLAGMSASREAVLPSSFCASALAINHVFTLFCNRASPLAFMQSIMLAVTDFPRENLPKQCLAARGETP